MKKEKKITSHFTTGSEIKKILCGNNIPHTIEYTNTTIKIELQNGSNQVFIINDSEIPINDLSLINEVKRNAEKLDIENTKTTSRDISFFQWGKVRVGKYKGFVEVDVNKAYWEIAFQKGYINKKTYLRGMNKIPGKKPIRKQTRLMALGSMATVKNKYEWNGKDYDHIEKKVNETTRSYFFDVAKTLDGYMKEAFGEFGRSVLFYWVDAIYIDFRQVEKMKTFFLERGLEVKTKEIKNILVRGCTDKSKKVFVTEMESQEDDRCNIRIKYFFVPPEKKYLEAFYRNIFIESLGKIK